MNDEKKEDLVRPYLNINRLIEHDRPGNMQRLNAFRNIQGNGDLEEKKFEYMNMYNVNQVRMGGEILNQFGGNVGGNVGGNLGIDRRIGMLPRVGGAAFNNRPNIWAVNNINDINMAPKENKILEEDIKMSNIIEQSLFEANVDAERRRIGVPTLGADELNRKKYQNWP
jgi:hypothetical protein